MAKRGPTIGSRILVKLPFGRDKTSGNKPASQLIEVKQGVAKVLGFEPVKALPVKTVAFKTARGSAKAPRMGRGSYKRKSVKLIFKAPKTITGSKGQYKTVSLPMPSGVTLDDIVKYFHTGAGRSKGVIALVSPDGRRIQWAEATLSNRR